MGAAITLDTAPHRITNCGMMITRSFSHALTHMHTRVRPTSAVALCGEDMENICDPGGGEEILRHGRSQFLVSGAGEKQVNGVYKAAAIDDHRLNPDLYVEGAVYIQDGCASVHDGLDDDDCEHHVLVHRVLGNHRFWALCSLQDGDAGPAIYHAWSEDVEPPFSGWRPGEPPVCRVQRELGCLCLFV